MKEKEERNQMEKLNDGKASEDEGTNEFFMPSAAWLRC